MQEAKSLFKKLKIISLLDLALLTPSSYNNCTLSTNIEVGETNTFEAVVEDVSNFNGKLRIHFWIEKFNLVLNYLSISRAEQRDTIPVARRG